MTQHDPESAARDSWTFWPPVVVTALGYVAARISPAAGFFLPALALTPVARRSFLNRAWLWEVLSLAYLVFFFFDLFFLSRHLGTAITHLLMFLLVSRCWVRPIPRVLGQRLVLAVVFWILIGAVNNDVYFFYFSLAMTPALVLALMGYQARLFEPGGGSLRPLLPQAWVISLALIPVGLFLFFLMPRYHLGYFATWQLQTSESISGLGSSVDLSGITRIKAVHAPAFRVRWVRGTPPQDPTTWYWRGLVYDTFTGREWRHTLPSARRQITRGLLGSGIYPFRTAPPRSAWMAYRVEPYVFLPTLVHLGEPLFVRFTGSTLNLRPGLELHHETYRPYAVTAAWRTDRGGRYILRDAPGDPAATRRVYLQVPPNLVHLRRFLSERVGRTAPDLATAEAVERYLITHYRYTTAVYSLGESRPLDAFLAKKFAGHCEYFASAMAVLTRLAGLPTRLVTGFRGGELVDDQTVRVLQSQAHAWVEVFDAAAGVWVAYDPTPAREDTPGWAQVGALLRRWTGRIEAWWDEQIVLYTSSRQMEYLRALRDRITAVRRTLGRWMNLRRRFGFRPGPGWRRWGLLGVLLIAMVWAAVMRLLRRRREMPDRRASPIPAFRRLMRVVEKRAGPRRSSWTWEEYLKTVRDQYPEPAAQLRALIEWYYRLRYSPRVRPRERESFTRAVHRARKVWERL